MHYSGGALRQDEHCAVGGRVGDGETGALIQAFYDGEDGAMPADLID